jgi:hypothetical protein
MNSIETLEQFRKQTYDITGKGRDALFDLMDAVLTTPSVSSLVEFSLSPVFQRKWPSVYEAIQDGRPPRQALMKEYVKQIPEQELLVIAGDHTAWSRPHAKTLQERTYEHQPQAMEGAKPITVGQGYSTIAWIPESQGSWALPLLHERITSFDKPIDKAANQLRQVAQEVNSRILYLGDSEYGCAPFVRQTADINCDKLLRLRPNRVLYQAPGVYGGLGRPYKHGNKFSLKDAATWSCPEESLTVEDPKIGRLSVRLWKSLHFRQAADHPFTVILVERLDIPQSQPLWLLWFGDSSPILSQLWQQYLRRFAIEHWYRFLRQRLHWTVPQLSTPLQMETWSDLMPLLTWQLWLARDVVVDSPLPWQKTMTRLTPGRVANSFATVLCRIGSPASVPKPRGKSPGWPTGKARTQRTRYPTVRKGFTKPKKATSAVA